MEKPNKQRIIPVILCGGQGTRLWPMSRPAFPKQFARLFSEKSLLQETVELVRNSRIFEQPLIIGSESFEHILVSQLKEIDVNKPRLILEPEGKNTAAAIALACHTCTPDDILLVLPSDHHITDKQQFHSDVLALMSKAEDQKICVFGIKPDHASSDYGYINIENKFQNSQTHFSVKNFKEKPDPDLAKAFLASGSHYWNAGIFLFSCKAMLNELEKFAPKIKLYCKRALKHGQGLRKIKYPDPECFSNIPSLPIDMAVMEKTDCAYMGVASFDWLDVGSWKSYGDTCSPDANGNSITGDAVLENCHENVIYSEDKLVTAIDLEGHVIIDTDDALLIMPKDRASELSPLVKKMKAKGIKQATSHKKVRRPWGSYKGVHQGSQHQVKHIIVKAGEKLSSQYHYYRSEHWTIVSGKGIVTLGEKEQKVKANDSVYIPVGVTHRLHNPFKEELHLIEVQCGDYLGEDDIVRLEDVYGRVNERDKSSKSNSRNEDLLMEEI